MATMHRVIMATNRIARGCRLPSLFAVALLASLAAALMTVSAKAQTAAQDSSLPAGSAAAPASSAGKTSQSTQGQGPIMVPADISEMRIAPGDLLSVNVYDSPELSSAYRVDPAGNIAIPLCGKVKVGGMTLSEAARDIETALKDGQILVHPQVNVDLLQYAGQYVTITGQVETPGRLPLFAPARLVDVLAEAGGETPMAGARIRIRHGSGDSATEQVVSYLPSHANSKAASVIVRPGDSIDVPRAGIVYVLGAVNRPGGYVMQEDGKLNVAEALAMAGGTVLTANTGGLRVIRRNPDGTVLDFPLSYDAIAKGTQTPLALQARDIVYVPMSKVKASLTSTLGIISSAASAAIVTTR